MTFLSFTFPMTMEKKVNVKWKDITKDTFMTKISKTHNGFAIITGGAYIVIDFDTKHTKVSCDSNGGFFDVYMDGLQPERYYRILIKTTLDGSTTVVDNQNIFKVVRNG